MTSVVASAWLKILDTDAGGGEPSVAGDPFDWPAWITAGATALTMAILGVTAWFAHGALSDARKTRHGQLIIALNEQLARPFVVESMELHGKYPREAIAALVERLFGPTRERDEADLDTFYKLAVWPNQIEMIGVLRREEAITSEVIYRMWGGGIIGVWEQWEPAIEKLREHATKTESADAFEYFQEVALAMQEIARARHGASAVSATYSQGAAGAPGMTD